MIHAIIWLVFTLVPGLESGFSAWTEFSPCTVTCGTAGVNVRTRTCDPSITGSCLGVLQETRNCLPPVPLHCLGKWSDWTWWSTCSKSCDVGNQIQTRNCDPPQNHCPGLGKLSRTCFVSPCPIGQWVAWTAWSSCSQTCGAGRRRRSRECMNGKCFGLDAENLPCNEGVCLTNESGSRAAPLWTAWTVWTPCDKACNAGQQTRTRICPLIGQCPGLGKENKPCNKGSCPLNLPGLTNLLPPGFFDLIQQVVGFMFGNNMLQNFMPGFSSIFSGGLGLRSDEHVPAANIVHAKVPQLVKALPPNISNTLEKFPIDVQKRIIETAVDNVLTNFQIVQENITEENGP